MAVGSVVVRRPGIGRPSAVALTDREKDILRLAANGASDYRIARRLRVNSGTVSRQRKRALAKLDKARSDLAFAEKLKPVKSQKD